MVSRCAISGVLWAGRDGQDAEGERVSVSLARPGGGCVGWAEVLKSVGGWWGTVAGLGWR